MHSTKSNEMPLPKPTIHLNFEAIGTVWVIDIYQDISSQTVRSLSQAIAKRIEIYDRNYSRFRSDSLVTTMATPGMYILPDDAQPLFDLYHHLYQITDGAMTPLIGQTLSDAGYDATYSLQAKQLQHPPTWEEALTYKYPQLITHQPVILDIGAAGKGYLVDIIGELLKCHGVTAFCIDAGGDILCYGLDNNLQEIGLEHPDQPGAVVGVAHITNQSLCGSSGSKRTWDRFTHIINPKTLESPRHIRALWVVADTALVADALAAALFFVEPGELQRDYAFECAIVHEDYSITHSEDFPATFFTETRGGQA